MRRKTFDSLLAAGGLVLAAVLLVAGGLLAWGHSFVENQVHTQLAAQKIFFPPAGSPALASPEIGPYLNQYAGQQLVNGAQGAGLRRPLHRRARQGGRRRADLRRGEQQGPGQPN